MRKSKSAEKNGKKSKHKVKLKQDTSLIKKDLLVRIKHLHSVARDAVKIYVENLERDFLKTEGHLENGESLKLKPAALKPVIRLIEDTSLKPEKGRRKDLKRIERILDAIDVVFSEKKR